LSSGVFLGLAGRRARRFVSVLSVCAAISGLGIENVSFAQPAKAETAPVKPAAQPAQPAQAGQPAQGTQKPKTAAKTAPRAQTKPPAGPKPLGLPPKSPVLNKADMYQKTAPAVVFLTAVDGNRFNTALGVVVHPNGAVVTDSRLLAGVEGGKVSAFLYDPSFAGDEDPLLFLRANQAKALPVQVVRSDSENHLLLLQLPEPPAKQPYKSLDLYDMKASTTVGVDVIGLKTRGRQTLAMMTGSVMAVRPGAIETDPPLTLDHTGGPLLSMNGRLLGIVTFAEKATDAPGVARSVSLLHGLLTGGLGQTVSAPKNTTPDAVSESPNAVEAVRIGLGNALAQKFDKQQALVWHSEFISSMALRGRLPIREIDSIEMLTGLIATVTKDSPAKGKVVSELFPLLVVDKKGRAYFRQGTKYLPVPTSERSVIAIDDATGFLFATDGKQALQMCEAAGKGWRQAHLSPVADIAVTQGTYYAIMADGRLLKGKVGSEESIQLWPKPLVGAKVMASQGLMYLFDGDKIYRYRETGWDNKLKPIAFAMKQVTMRGDTYYGLDLNGRVFASGPQRYIDRDANIHRLWPVGKDLLVLTKDNQRFFYATQDDQWRPWTQW